jgi:hypothetical protein
MNLKWFVDVLRWGLILRLCEHREEGKAQTNRDERGEEVLLHDTYSFWVKQWLLGKALAIGIPSGDG